jgi:hypothetical protein
MQPHELHELAIVVCTRDRPEMLEAALAALVATVDDCVDIIVVDSASRDSRTRQVVEKTRARYVRSAIAGLSIARNVGLRATDRRFIAYTDDDCVPMQGWAEQLVAGFTDQRVAAVSGRMLDHTLAHTIDSLGTSRTFTTPVEGLDAGHGAVMAFRREALLDINGFDEVLGAGRVLAGAEELDAFVRLIRAGHSVVNNPASVVMHANTREDQDYAKLHRGYGRGLGAMAGKWLRLSPPLGARLLLVSVFRSARRAVRAGRSDVRKRVSSIAMIEGIVGGVIYSLRLRLVGTTFVDAHPGRLAASQSAAPATSTSPATGAAAVKRGPARARPIRILDEKHVANTMAFVASRPAVTIIVDGEAFRLASGELDKRAIASHLEAWVGRIPALRQRLMSAPFGVLPPSWVPATEFDMGFHLRFSDTVVARDFLDTDVISGFHNGPMEMNRPLWTMLVVPLDSGELAFVGQIQHVVGDGIFAIRMMSDLLTTAPVSEPTTAPAELERAPRTPVELVRVAVAALRTDYSTSAEAVADFRRKPFYKRVRRTVGRNLRPFRNRAIDRRNLLATLPQRHTRVLETELTASKTLARQFGGTLNDLTVAATLIGLAAIHPEAATVATLVPVAPRASGGKDVRNNIRMVRVEVERSASLAAVLPQVHAQLLDAVDVGHSSEPAGAGVLTPSYASFLPTFPRTHYLGPAEVASVALWPTLQPHDELAVFSSSYRRTFAVAITVHASIDLDVFASAVAEALATPRKETA